MHISYKNLTVRNACPGDAAQLCCWWNDGAVMAHAGFPDGLGVTAEEIAADLALDTDTTQRRHIIMHGDRPIGEMNYRNKGSNTAEIGIKICEPNEREKGLGTQLLALFIDALFVHYGYDRIILDTNANNVRAQHVYEKKLGFTRLRLNKDSWQDGRGAWQSSIDYELHRRDWPTRAAAYREVLSAYTHMQAEAPANPI